LNAKEKQAPIDVTQGITPPSLQSTTAPNVESSIVDEYAVEPIEDFSTNTIVEPVKSDIDYAKSPVSSLPSESVPHGSLLVTSAPSTSIDLIKSEVDELRKLVEKIHEEQAILHEMLALSISSGRETNGLIILMGDEVKQIRNLNRTLMDEVGAVIVGQEAISKSVSQARVSTPTSSTQASAKPVAIRNTQPQPENTATPIKPNFRVTNHSIWGDDVNYTVETVDGFYRSAQIGVTIDGWRLVDGSVSDLLTRWEKDGASYVLRYN
jgi:hypothetical protein